jgi:hypothetical protein
LNCFLELAELRIILVGLTQLIFLAGISFALLINVISIFPSRKSQLFLGIKIRSPWILPIRGLHFLTYFFSKSCAKSSKLLTTNCEYPIRSRSLSARRAFVRVKLIQNPDNL